MKKSLLVALSLIVLGAPMVSRANTPAQRAKQFGMTTHLLKNIEQKYGKVTKAEGIGMMKAEITTAKQHLIVVSNSTTSFKLNTLVRVVR